MFSKRWIKLIILLFLAMLIPLILDSFIFDIVEGNVPLATACAQGTGAVSACAKLKASTDEATKAQAKLMADLKKKADEAAKKAADAIAKEAADAKKESDDLAAANKSLVESIAREVILKLPPSSAAKTKELTTIQKKISDLKKQISDLQKKIADRAAKKKK